MRPRCGKMLSMPTPPDFRLYHSNALEVLAGLLAALLAWLGVSARLQEYR